MKLKLKTILLAGVASLSAASAFAQQADLPDFLNYIDGVEYRGQMSGMDIYSMEGFQGIWLVSPDGMTAVAGTVFGSDGRDIGSAFTGAAPVRSFEVAPQAGGSIAGPAPAPAPTEPLVSQVPQNGVMTSAELDVMEEGISKIEEGILHPEVTAEHTDGAVDTAAVSQDAQDALEGFSEADKKVLTTALAELLKDVKNEREFQIAVKVWTEEIVRRHKTEVETTADSQIEAAVKASTDQTGDAAAHSDETESHTDVEPSAEEPAAVEETAVQDAEMTVADELLQEVRTDAMWFGLGKADSPVAYAFIDPTCPYCAKTIKNLDESIGTGKLQLRIMLAPVLSERSGQYIASILSHEEPPIAFLEHELGMAAGRSPLKPGDWEDIPGVLRDGLIHNADIMKEYGIRGVPFLVFDTKEGAKVINGVPTPEALSTALPDEYRGDM
jgi:protein-disulfide isomerase